MIEELLYGAAGIECVRIRTLEPELPEMWGESRTLDVGLFEGDATPWGLAYPEGYPWLRRHVELFAAMRRWVIEGAMAEGVPLPGLARVSAPVLRGRRPDVDPGRSVPGECPVHGDRLMAVQPGARPSVCPSCVELARHTITSCQLTITTASMAPEAEDTPEGNDAGAGEGGVQPEDMIDGGGGFRVGG
jgi:hypothetical protein